LKVKEIQASVFCDDVDVAETEWAEFHWRETTVELLCEPLATSWDHRESVFPCTEFMSMGNWEEGVVGVEVIPCWSSKKGCGKWDEFWMSKWGKFCEVGSDLFEHCGDGGSVLKREKKEVGRVDLDWWGLDCELMDEEVGRICDKVSNKSCWQGGICGDGWEIDEMEYGIKGAGVNFGKTSKKGLKCQSGRNWRREEQKREMSSP